MIDNAELEEIKRHHNGIRCFASRLRLTKTGTNKYRTHCPCHEDSTPSFDIWVYQRVWIFKCLGCGISGNVIQFIERVDGVSFRDAIMIAKQELCLTDDRVHTAVIHREAVPDKPKSYRTFCLSAHVVCEQGLAANPSAQAWLLNERGITYGTAQRLRFGYRQTITAKDIKLQDILDKGWLTFPCCDGDIGRMVKYRSIVRKEFARAPGMESWLFNSAAISSDEDVYVTEGEFDCAVLAQCGLRSVSIGSTTTPITTKMLDHIRRAKRVILAGDGDSNGAKKMQELRATIPGSLLLQWPGAKDANELFLRDHRGDGEGFRKRVFGLVVDAEKGGEQWVSK